MRSTVHHAANRAIAAILLIIGQACGHASVVEQRFRADYGCNDVEVTNIAGSTYGAEGCGKHATYTCGTDNRVWVGESACVREAPIQSPLEASRKVAVATPGHVGRRYDEKRKLQLLRADFEPERGTKVVLIGAPAAKLGDIFVKLDAPSYRFPSGKCESLEALINGIPVLGTMFATSTESTGRSVQSHFDFQQFKPLTGRLPSFGIRHCKWTVTLADHDVQQLLKFLALYSEMAIEVQQKGEPPAAPTAVEAM